jgi:hypothetical protein
MYTYKGLTTYEEDKPIYYIGDSKYYKLNNDISKESVYKQFTYARNVIQWNLNLFMNDNDLNDSDWKNKVSKLRDDVTEGYNIIPNFFISARLDKELSYRDTIKLTDKENTDFCNKQFENRLFDRDTLLICHYDVNFLYVVSLYARDNSMQKESWKAKVREMFREETQKILSDKFEFYAMSARPGVNAEMYIKEHFQEVLGKIYTPYSNKNIFSLALENDDKYEKDNEKLVQELSKYFYIEKCGIGENPENKITNLTSNGNTTTITRNGVLMVMMESYSTKSLSFLSNGKLAIGMKWTKDSMEIVENIKSIGYVLFHHRSNDNKHLFAVNGFCRILNSDELENDRYKNVKDKEMYVVVDLNTLELDSNHLHVKQKDFTPKTRYDAQYANIEELL